MNFMGYEYNDVDGRFVRQVERTQRVSRCESVGHHATGNLFTLTSAQ